MESYEKFFGNATFRRKCAFGAINRTQKQEKCHPNWIPSGQQYQEVKSEYYSRKCSILCFLWRRNNFRGNNFGNFGSEGTIWENCSLLREQKNTMVSAPLKKGTTQGFEVLIVSTTRFHRHIVASDDTRTPPTLTTKPSAPPAVHGRI